MKHFALSMTLGAAALLAAPAVATPVGDSSWMADFDAAQAVAKKEGKHLLVDFTGSDWCSWCIKLDKEVFAHDSWKEAATKDYILVALDFPNDPEILAKVPDIARNRELAKEYSVGGYPTILLMTAEGDVFGKTGYQKGGPDSYLTHMAGLKEKGMPQVKAVMALADEFQKAEGDARFAVWDKVSAMLEKEGPSVGAGRKLFSLYAEGLTLDPKNERGMFEKTLNGLFAAGKYSDDYFAKALTYDPKNEKGIYAAAMDARMQQVNWRDKAAMKEAMGVVEAFASMETFNDVDQAINMFSFSAMICSDQLEDPKRALMFAKKATSLGDVSNSRFGKNVKAILEAAEAAPETEEVIEEVVEQP